MFYLASPYSHPDPAVREFRFREVCRTAAALLRSGIDVFSPVAHSHPIARFGVPTTWEFWQRVDHEYLQSCEGLVVLRLAGWEESVGVRAELELARRWGMPVIEIDPPSADGRETRLNGNVPC